MKKGLVGTGIAVIVICGGGAFAWQGWQAQMAAASKKVVQTATVTKGNVKVVVIENGTIDSVQSVEVKSRVTGRLAKLMVDEGDRVEKGQLIAIIDPQETEFRVRQDAAQLRGAVSAAARTALEIEQRRESSRATLAQAISRVKSLEMEVKSQPILTKAAIDEAQTTLDVALEEKTRLVRSVHPTEKSQAEAQVREAEANVQNAQTEVNRQEELLKSGYVAIRSVETARLNVELANSRLENAKVNLSRTPARHAVELRKADEQIASARATLSRAKANAVQNPMKEQDLASARAEVQKARTALRDAEVLAKTREQNLASVDQLQSILDDSRRNLGETEIRAPIAGIVVKKGIQVGELATGLSTFGSGSTIVKIEDRGSMRVKLNMNEIDVAKLTLGMKATVDVDALPADQYTGKVNKIAPASTDSAAGAAATDAVVRYQVEIIIDNPNERLRSGMSAKCSLAVIDRQGVLTLPVDYVKKEGRKAFAFFPPDNPKDPKAKAKQVSITIGAQSGSVLEITSGLKDGDKVVKPDYDGPDRKSFINFGGGDDE
ncbi:multidrug efflux system subunit MdtA [Fimbriimonadaceae bacterium]